MCNFKIKVPLGSILELHIALPGVFEMSMKP